MRYYPVELFHKGFTLVEDFDGRFSLIDKKGTWLQPISNVGSREEKEDVEWIKKMLVRYWTSQILYTGEKLGIIDLLAEKPKTAVEVAETLDLDAQIVGRLPTFPTVYIDLKAT